jgi:uncharacterized membrane protein
MNQEQKINELLTRLERLGKVVGDVQEQLHNLKTEVEALRNPFTEIPTIPITEPEILVPVQEHTDNPLSSPDAEEFDTFYEKIKEHRTQNKSTHAKQATPKEPFNFEDFIGGNVLSKLGILILIIGVGVFVNYAIEHNLISPLGRVALAYLAGAVLIGVAYWLKDKYLAYSAVLMSGGIATLYFTTYFGYSFLGLMPQLVAFVLMFGCTVFGVYQAIQYKQEVIGIIGLVGGYAVPIMIGKGGGNPAILWAYMSIINVGVMLLAFRLDWERMRLTAFGITWLVFLGWFSTAYQAQYFTTTVLFAGIFFIIFYASLLVYQVREKQLFREFQLFFLLLNSLMFYGVGWAIINFAMDIEDWLSGTASISRFGTVIFTLLNVAIHGGVAWYIYPRKQIDPQIWYFTTGMAVLLLTFAVPLYFDTEVITGLWVVESLLLFVAASRQRIIFFEHCGYVLSAVTTLSVIFTFGGMWMTGFWLVEMVALLLVAKRLNYPWLEWISYGATLLGAISAPYHFESNWVLYIWLGEMMILFALARALQSEIGEFLSYGLGILSLFAWVKVWQIAYLSTTYTQKFSQLPILNDFSIVSGILILSILIILWIDKKYPLQITTQVKSKDDFRNIILHFQRYFNDYVGLLLVFVLFFTGWWKFYVLHYNLQSSNSLFYFITLFLYFIGFWAAFLWTNEKYIQKEFYRLINFGAHLIGLGYIILALPTNFLGISLHETQRNLTPDFVFFLRFAVYLLSVVWIWSIVKTYQPLQSFRNEVNKSYFIFANIFTLALLSFELVATVSMLNPAAASLADEVFLPVFKVGFSLLWSLYALGLISFGIRYKRKYLRLTGFAVLALTLAKLFLNDVSYQSNLNIIIVFISVGILLMVTAFLYQKYKPIILAEDE